MRPRAILRLLFVVIGVVLVLYVAWQASTIRRTARVDPVQQPAGRAGDPRLYPPQAIPGSVDEAVNQENVHQTICISGYTASVRPATKTTNRIKRELMVEYQLPGQPLDYELDHMIPLELGGCPDCLTNLWMEPLTSAREKDRVENYLHREVCRDQLSLAAAQKLIAQDWYSVYLTLNLTK
jgi:hypothetical protein